MEKHLCKICGKRFPTGRSLGGHMRSHIPPPPPHHRRPPPGTETKPRYGLRENPKKKRLVDLATITHQPFRSQRSSKEAMPPVRKRRSAAACEHELELEEGAISLMMLSRGVRSWGSSDTNSGSEEDAASDVSGYHWNWLNTTESDASDDDDKELRKPKTCAFVGKPMEDAPSCNLYDGQVDALSKIEPLDAYSAKFLQSTSLYECTGCNKTFHSYQALGGHRSSNKRSIGGRCRQNFNGSSECCLQMNASLVMDTDFGNGSGYRSSVKMKIHECFICGKVFQSGQALGGHKRAHLMASSSDGVCDAASQQQSPEMPSLIDLNIPASMDGKSTNANYNSVFKPCWVESNLTHEQLSELVV